jgi:hypothetical protein
MRGHRITLPSGVSKVDARRWIEPAAWSADLFDAQVARKIREALRGIDAAGRACSFSSSAIETQSPEGGRERGPLVNVDAAEAEAPPT